MMGLWFLLVNLRLRRKLRAALPVEADCPLQVRVSPDLPSPCLCGVIRPVIFVTPDALPDSDRMRHVLAHELRLSVPVLVRPPGVVGGGHVPPGLRAGL